MDAASVVLALDGEDDEAANLQRRRCLEIIETGQAPSGGWGPYVSSSEEPFDTALVLLALNVMLDEPDLANGVYSEVELREAVSRGRAFLFERQVSEGGWPETTRPPGQLSYAQYLSTSGWVTLALIRTAP